MTVCAPLEDPAYVPANPPVGGRVPDVVAKWGPRSQVRWFTRFQGTIAAMPHSRWDLFYCDSEQHRGQCCDSCMEDIANGYQDYDAACCCCRALRERS